MKRIKEELPHISENFIKILLRNHQNYPNEIKNDNGFLTGSPFSEKKLDKFINYMRLCTNIYTDTNTRRFVASHDVSNITNRWRKIIDDKINIDILYQDLLTTQNGQSQIICAPTVSERPGGLFGQIIYQVSSLPPEKRLPNLVSQYTMCIQAINNFLQTILNRNPIEAQGLDQIESAKEQLDNIRQEIHKKFSWHFNHIKYNSGQPFQHNGNNYQLNSQAVIAASFLHKSELLSNRNITILDVGFRNLEDLMGIWNTILAGILQFKNNPMSFFENLGEVDFIAYTEHTIEHTSEGDKHVDKLVIVYSGSNSLKDWVRDVNLGWTEFEELSVQEGIANLVNESIKNYFPLLIDRIRDYYKNYDKPAKFKIITMGHSLGGAEALLAAYYYKKRKRQDLAKILGINEEDILVKTVTFGAPAILAKESIDRMEMAFGKENISRVWNHGDKVISFSKKFSYHYVGRSFPFYNISNNPFNRLEAWWAPHGLGHYQNYLKALKDPSQNHKHLAQILKDYINPET
ncbi:hypothetical protein ID47_03075 [Candidatus Paracaedibacter acanthamoebae]|uniref:Fungal lipase-type domain-containing protein n=2 Tax=Candidatus Odyssella acanthamoebae TaxID=91604 RepID=A0A077ARZ8_9PROT|nr:hypothetical protein ID47_03075 [Candidatus Paracaedibacter acanthamoebae]